MLRKIARFTISGLAATAVHFTVAWLVFRFLCPKADVANAVAFIVANVASYVLHTLYSFSARMSPAQFIRFAVVSAVGFGLSAGLPVLIGPHRFWLSTAVVMVAVPTSSFLLHNFWTYRR